MAYLVIPTQTVPLWNWGGTTGKLRIFSSQAFYEHTTGAFTPSGNPQNVSSACQIYNCTVSGTNFTIPEVTLATTTDSTVPNALYTAILYDSADRPRYTMLANFFVDPEYFSTPELSDVQVLSAGSPIVDGIYTLRGTYDEGSGEFPYYTLTGQANPDIPPDDPSFQYSVFSDGNLWYLRNSAGENMYFGSTGVPPTSDYPWDADWAQNPLDGIAPAPNVTEYVTEISGTWEQLTLSNQGYGVVVPWSTPGPFWDVQQTKEYVNTVVGDGSSPVPYASTSTAGKTKLDTAPVSSTSPIAVGTNSSIITGFTADIASLNTLKAPKANPTFTGTVAVTGNITATTTIAATGNVTGANLSGTNTGNVTVGGENYISLAGQVLTANAVNLSATNVTGTLAAARFPALTGDVTNSAGTVATTIANLAVGTAKIANLAVTDAKVATGIDAVKIADGSVTNTEFQYLNGVTSGLQAQIDAKAGLVSPSFTTPALGTPSAGVLTNCTITTPAAGDNDTSIASTAFVQQLGNGCLVYRATLTQTGTSAPVATIIANTLGGTVVWARGSAGFYTGTLASVFSANKTQVFVGTSPNGANFVATIAWRSSSSEISILTQDTDIAGGTCTASDNMLAETALTIIVGP